jgi:hypothetical protein
MSTEEQLGIVRAAFAGASWRVPRLSMTGSTPHSQACLASTFSALVHGRSFEALACLWPIADTDRIGAGIEVVTRGTYRWWARLGAELCYSDQSPLQSGPTSGEGVIEQQLTTGPAGNLRMAVGLLGPEKGAPWGAVMVRVGDVAPEFPGAREDRGDGLWCSTESILRSKQPDAFAGRS